MDDPFLEIKEYLNERLKDPLFKPKIMSHREIQDDEDIVLQAIFNQGLPDSNFIYSYKLSDRKYYVTYHTFKGVTVESRDWIDIITGERGSEDVFELTKQQRQYLGLLCIKC